MANIEIDANIVAANADLYKESLIRLKPTVLQIEKNISDYARGKWNFGPDPNYVVFRMMELSLGYLRRIEELITAARHMQKLNLVVAGTIVGRAIIETSAMCAYYELRMNKHLENNDYDSLESDFLRFYSGSKIAKEGTQAINVLTAIDRTSENLSKEHEKLITENLHLIEYDIATDMKNYKDNSSLRSTYNKLSEVSHPNGLGTHVLYPFIASNESKFVYDYFEMMIELSIMEARHAANSFERMIETPSKFAQIFPDIKNFKSISEIL